MRPRAIILFERLYLASLIVSALGVVSFLSVFGAITDRDRIVAMVVAIATLCLFALLVLRVSRRRNRLAKWALVGLTALTAAFWLYTVGRSFGLVPLDWPGLVQHLLQIVATILLFTAPARAWLEEAHHAA